ncbi:MAG: Acetylornithine deacetylase [uncultured Thermomicrobiales bacterium]|uniref:Probable succinyl-diaminopimelate desuccinylase n=1 Tax=uncultured Thermomicrobiales bacterium TaxID=1645740 RepID=A0A6J4VVM7_9BACT|nr:MAG: Acetylornithine deacetylase [uncultured Thermomicrobiales bacterium]
MTARDTDLTAAIARVVEARRGETLRLLQDFVRVPCVTGDEGAVQEVVAAAFAESRLAVERVSATPEGIAPYHDHVGEETRFANRPNIVGIRRGAGGGRSILLNGHVDTVEVGDPATWTRDPLGGEIVGDRLYGRGACDMKGGIVSFIAALETLDALGIRLRGDVTVAATVGEEDGGVGALAVILAGYRADAVLITEPTRLALVPAQGGSLVFRLTVPGRAAHAAVRDEGVSALEAFLPIFEDLRALERDRNATLDHPLYAAIANKVPINIGVVRAGNWASTVPESLVAEGRIGLIPGEEVAPFRAFIEERIFGVAAQNRWLVENPPTLEWFGGQFAPAEVPADAPICRAVMAAHERVTGAPPTVAGVPYGADMRLFIRLGEMPCVMYGAGDVNHAHRADEHISVPELLTATRTIAHLLIDWCGVAE